MYIRHRSLFKIDSEAIDLLKDLRFLVVDDEADEVSVVPRAIALPGEFDPCAAGAVGLKLQDGASTCGPVEVRNLLLFFFLPFKQGCTKGTKSWANIALYCENL